MKSHAPSPVITKSRWHPLIKFAITCLDGVFVVEVINDCLLNRNFITYTNKHFQKKKIRITYKNSWKYNLYCRNTIQYDWTNWLLHVLRWFYQGLDTTSWHALQVNPSPKQCYWTKRSRLQMANSWWPK